MAETNAAPIQVYELDPARAPETIGESPDIEAAPTILMESGGSSGSLGTGMRVGAGAVAVTLGAVWTTVATGGAELVAGGSVAIKVGPDAEQEPTAGA